MAAEIEGLSHITLIVADLEKTGRMLTALFGAKEVYDSRERNFSVSREKFFLIGELWLALMTGPPLSEKTYNHIAFKVPAGSLAIYRQKVLALGLAIKEDRSRIPAEAQSLYFFDYDDHLFELHTGTLAERLAGYSRINREQQNSDQE